jgi:hypothetical protein
MDATKPNFSEKISFLEKVHMQEIKQLRMKGNVEDECVIYHHHFRMLRHDGVGDWLCFGCERRESMFVYFATNSYNDQKIVPVF